MKKYEKEILQNRLDSEEQLIKELDKLYEKVSKDCSKKIAALSARSDLENLQSIIYQEQYQQALKDEIDGLLNVLHSDEFKTISAYTTACYQNGFIGTMYSLHKQGIPLILPINQEAVIKAVQLDSKISEGLYLHLGESISEMKDNIRAEVSRGVTAGLTYNQISVNIAKGMNTPFTKAKFYATRIARTEGGRIANSSAMDACYKAKKKGCDIVKQWDSTLDGDTRPSHQKCDGEIRELDEKFSNGLMFPGDPSGGVAEVINCRCVVLQRARIALDEEDLAELIERAAFFGLDKTENFEDFKQKYLQATTLYTENERITKNIQFAIDSRYIESREYSNKFDIIAKNAAEKRVFLQSAKEMLHHRSGQNGEDLHLYNRTTQKLYKSTSGIEAGKPEYTEEILNIIKKSQGDELIALHNHPASMPPSASDINSALYNNYSVGYTLCHDGKIFEYTAGNRYIDEAIYNLYIDKNKKIGYNEYDAQLKTMQYLAERYGFSFKEVK